MKPVEKYSYGYEIARFWVHITLRWLFYRKWKIRGLEKIDPKQPTIFAANHQNALMDALQIVMLSKAQPIFLARADIFKKRPVARILNWMKIMPVYRIRDGYDSLQKNDEVFEKCAAVLSNGNSLAIFPEGNHGDQRHLRMLKKGLARIAFGAEKVRDYKLGVRVVPLGIDYSHYENFRARVTVSIGDPIVVNDFSHLYREDVQKGYKALNNEISNRLYPHMIDIPWESVYDGVMATRTIFSERYREKNNLPGKSLLNRFDADKLLIDDIRGAYENNSEKATAILHETSAYLNKLKNLNLRDHIPAKEPYNFFTIFLQSVLLIVMFPLFLYGLLNNFHIFRIPGYLSRKLFKDPQFRSSVSYVLAFVVMMPVFYFLQTLVLALIVKTWWIPVVYLISLIPTGLFAIHYSFWFKKTRARWKFWWLKLRNNKKIIELINTRSGLISDIDTLLS